MYNAVGDIAYRGDNAKTIIKFSHEQVCITKECEPYMKVTHIYVQMMSLLHGPCTYYRIFNKDTKA